MQEEPAGLINQLLTETRRRNLFRVTAVFSAAAFVVLQLADILFPAIGLKDEAIAWLLGAIALLFPIVLAGAWAWNGRSSGSSITLYRGVRPSDGIILILALCVGYLYIERLTDTPETAAKDQHASQQNDNRQPHVAVLPFDNLSSSEDNAFFAAGIHEDILNRLSQINGLIVTSRTSTLSYADTQKPVTQIADELGVTHLLEGSVRRFDQQVRISVQLIDGANDTHVWSTAYNRELKDIFAIQDEVALQVADALKVQFDLGPISEVDLEAYDLFLQARALASTIGTKSLADAITLYRRALTLDPDYADAWAGLSVALTVQLPLIKGSDPELSEARQAAETALNLAPKGWLSHYAMANYLAAFEVGRYLDANRHFELAMRDNPNDGRMLVDYGLSLWNAGDIGRARVMFKKAYQRDPLSADGMMANAYALFIDGKATQATEFTERALSIDDRPYLLWFGAVLQVMNNDIETGVRLLSRAVAQNPRHLASLYTLAQAFEMLSDPVTADIWLTRAEQIQPHNTQVIWRRLSNLTSTGDSARYTRIMEEWLARDPDNVFAKRFEGYLYMGHSDEAFDREDLQAWRTLRQKALDTDLSFLRETGGGELRVEWWNSWSFLTAASSAKVLGDEALSRKLYLMIVDYYKAQPDGSVFFEHLQLTIAKAGLGRREEALGHLSSLADAGYSEIRMLRNYDVVEDRFNLYGLKDDVTFQRLIAQVEQRNRDVRGRIQQDLPHLFEANEL
jgi:adenylate cyclase